jgi:hypothetical protein
MTPASFLVGPRPLDATGEKSCRRHETSQGALLGGSPPYGHCFHAPDGISFSYGGDRL